MDLYLNSIYVCIIYIYNICIKLFLTFSCCRISTLQKLNQIKEKVERENSEKNRKKFKGGKKYISVNKIT